MVVKEKGQVYTLQTAEGYPVTDISFCRKDESGKFVDGITNEELLNILESRMEVMVQKKQSAENINALTHIRQAKWQLNSRNHRKINNNKNKQHDSSRSGVQLQT